MTNTIEEDFHDMIVVQQEAALANREIAIKNKYKKPLTGTEAAGIANEIKGVEEALSKAFLEIDRQLIKLKTPVQRRYYLLVLSHSVETTMRGMD